MVLLIINSPSSLFHSDLTVLTHTYYLYYSRKWMSYDYKTYDDAAAHITSVGKLMLRLNLLICKTVMLISTKISHTNAHEFKTSHVIA